MSQIQSTSSSSYAIQWQYMQAMQQSGTDPLTQPSTGDSTAFDPFSSLGSATRSSGNGNAGPPFSLATMSALIGAQEQNSSTSGLSPQQQKIFGELDADGDGKVTGTELQNAFGSDNKDAANYVMNKLDTNGDGSISQAEFGAGTTRTAGHHHHHMHAPSPPSDGSQRAGGAQGAQDPLSQLLSADGANSSTTSNSDGSTTTTVTYADGSKVSMTSAASAAPTSSDNSASTSTSGSKQSNLLEQLIKLQAQLTQSFSATTPVVTI